MIGTTCSGWLTDRLDPRHLLAWYYALRGLAVIALPFAFGSGYALVAFAVFYGLDWVATVPPTVALTADTFGRERVGIVFGWIFAVAPVRRGVRRLGRRRLARAGSAPTTTRSSAPARSACSPPGSRCGSGSASARGC